MAGDSPGYGAEYGHRAVRAAATALQTVLGGAPALVEPGGSAPTTALREHLGAGTIDDSFSSGDEDIHAPSDSCHPERFELGLQAPLWRALASAGRTV